MRMYGIKRWIVFAFILCTFMNQTAVYGGPMKGENKMTVSAGKEVSIEYTLRLEDKSVVDTNVGAEPLIYTNGSHHIITGLEKGMEGMTVGETRQITVKPEEGYGTVDQDAFIEVKKTELPPDALKIGTQVQGEDVNGRIVHAKITEVKDETVILDFNHPLAGKTLYFDVKVLDIQMETK